MLANDMDFSVGLIPKPIFRSPIDLYCVTVIYE